MDLIGAPVKGLEKLSEELSLSLNRDEMIMLAHYFRDPEKPNSMGEFVESVRAIGEFCRKFKLPVVAGNVSLYNGSSSSSIIPSPTILFTGICENVTAALSSEFKGSYVYFS